MPVIKTLLFIFVTLSTIQVNARTSKRLSASIQDDLAAYSGSYELAKGRADQCPDGEFSAIGDKFLVGAQFMVSGINQGVIKDPRREGECQSQSKSDFDGRSLIHIAKTTCANGTVTQTKYIFQFYTQVTTRYIKLNFITNADVKGSSKSSKSYNCLYTMDLNNQQ